jgi:hypothetical protein
MDNKDRDKMSRSTTPTSAGNVNRSTSERMSQDKDGNSAEFGNKIGRTEDMSHEPDRGSGGSSQSSKSSKSSNDSGSSGSRSSSTGSDWQSSGSDRGSGSSSGYNDSDKTGSNSGRH